ncbi:CDP-diacylglycerol--serine O-phosphatidyltransferase [Aureibacter tunicatorum]|uniref:CDP-diacylglycerol--serine O-phosphatidyltransferase n=1 Tax=Aureibacter tunicatorum TaxID=866807 RepID=A0AAE4BQS4_9BACT|nr:CDP-diacylglycerol--serine O-phosphatidyltransferase [Aureibacter tunicatorum]MDR6237223.1 CDP-diacylglycerol--serine O-phosphatidyltransferase [Aureibacter tunicatorum]BDD06215.1 CDP-diacylglycerol--serine O-phosphatidyltransferase [Aureibacter tunicatorum]
MKIFNLANLLTCLNLLSGCVGIVMAFQGNLEIACMAIWTGAVFDFFDGFAARLTKTNSDMGKELDSLADVVTFGVLPAMIIFHLIAQQSSSEWLPYAAFVIAAFSALRLAKFNIDTRQSMGFIGLPTPANAFFISSLPFVINDNIYGIGDTVSQPYFLILVSLVFSFLLISEIPMMALKFKNYSWKDNKAKFIFIITCLVAGVLLKVTAIPVIIIGYIVLSFFTEKKKESI